MRVRITWSYIPFHSNKTNDIQSQFADHSVDGPKPKVTKQQSDMLSVPSSQMPNGSKELAKTITNELWRQRKTILIFNRTQFVEWKRRIAHRLISIEHCVCTSSAIGIIVYETNQPKIKELWESFLCVFEGDILYVYLISPRKLFSFLGCWEDCLWNWWKNNYDWVCHLLAAVNLHFLA